MKGRNRGIDLKAVRINFKKELLGLLGTILKKQLTFISFV